MSLNDKNPERRSIIAYLERRKRSPVGVAACHLELHRAILERVIKDIKEERHLE